MVYNALTYISTFPELDDDQKWTHLQNEWRDEQLETGLISSQKLTAVLEKVKKRLDVFTPMIYYNLQKDRKDWVVNYYGDKFEYFGLPIVNLDLNSKKIQYPFGKEGKTCFIDYWKEEDENRDFGNLLARYSYRFDQKMKKL